MRGDRGGQDARGRREPPVESEFAQRHVALDRVGRDRADRGHHRERDGQVVVAAFLGQVGRREVHHDALRRQAQARGGECGAYPLAGFLDGLVRQADDDERRPARR